LDGSKKDAFYAVSCHDHAGFWITTGDFLGWICHIISAYTA